LNVNGLGVKAIKKLHDQDIASGDIESGSIVTVVYDGTNFQMTSQLATEAGGVALTGSTANTVTTVTGADAITGEAKLLFDPPTLTIGNATAEDTKIVFDGNAQDYHVGLDDSSDSFTIGLGTTLGTTSHIVSNASGQVTMPLQAMCLVRSGGATNVTGDNTQYVMTFTTEIYDIGGVFSSATFTAPVTGKYLFTAKTYISGLTASHDRGSFGIVTSNYTDGYWFFFGNPGALRDNNNAILINGSIVADMDASDTCQVKLTIGGGSQVVDVGGADTQFSATLLA
jgi:hypothetical protein